MKERIVVRIEKNGSNSGLWYQLNYLYGIMKIPPSKLVGFCISIVFMFIKGNKDNE